MSKATNVTERCRNLTPNTNKTDNWTTWHFSVMLVQFVSLLVGLTPYLSACASVSGLSVSVYLSVCPTVYLPVCFSHQSVFSSHMSIAKSCFFVFVRFCLLLFSLSDGMSVRSSVSYNN